MTKPLVILGGGGHSAVLIDVLRQQNREIFGLVSPNFPPDSRIFNDIPHFTTDEEVLAFDKNTVQLVNGIGSLPGNNLRAEIYKKFISLGYEFESVVSRNAVVSEFAELGSGVQVMSGAVIQAGVSIGSNSIVNTGAIIDHDCNLGANNHIAPGVTLSGMVSSGESVHFGTGSSVIQSITIGNNVVVGAGATITKNIVANTICMPASGKIRDLK